jgi:hypothetical protein
MLREAEQTEGAPLRLAPLGTSPASQGRIQFSFFSVRVAIGRNAVWPGGVMPNVTASVPDCFSSYVSWNNGSTPAALEISGF